MKFKNHNNRSPLDILIFDMDGVLIDVSHSYRKTIQKTIQIYFETCLGFEKSKGWIVSDKEISLLKSVGGFNNDWDLTSGLLLYLLSTSGIPARNEKKKFSSIEETVLYLRLKLSEFYRKKALQLNRNHLSSFLQRVKASGEGLQGIRQALEDSWSGWIYRSGDIDKENIVKRIFQEIYLGEKFASHYHLQPLFYRQKGLYLREKLLIRKEILSRLRKKLRLGIASGRPRFEAELALRKFNLHHYFDSVVTLDECREEEAGILLSTGKKIKLSKPHPYPILKAVQEIGIPAPRCGYVGDVVDDMRAAKAAKKNLPMIAIGFLSAPYRHKAARDSLLKAGADLIIANPKELLQFVS